MEIESFEAVSTGDRDLERDWERGSLDFGEREVSLRRFTDDDAAFWSLPRMDPLVPFGAKGVLPEIDVLSIPRAGAQECMKTQSRKYNEQS